ncbi:response regulator with CheY-like receiver, AAA-type ATPase, and DNA-binding domains [Acidovorax sp. CF316]|uniref:response regulator n=1 Tax=Acidovorax sp. CF316 TaxID=1144317 RepID=UPI00026BEE2B|nr:response regulator [Acidovorax sp. CF316]EJE48580.1 response regulator with CheY-like receiver, AAA-type ATPase, and DNA-binding domains [Acidovorax sp. CF316]
MRILYVEDNPELRETIGMLMEGEGRTIVTCATAEEALELERDGVFDLLVTDVSLPGLSGTDLARQVLAVDPGRWVVLCTGYDLGAHPSGWGPHVRTLMKPFELEDLEALLVQVHSTLDDSPSGR